MFQAANDFGVLGGIDASVSRRCRDHGFDVERRGFIRDSCRFKARTLRRGFRRCCAGDQWLASLIVLEGFVGETTNQCERANFCNASCNCAAGLRAKHQTTCAAQGGTGCHRVLLHEFLQLGEDVSWRLTNGLADLFAGTGCVIEAAGAFSDA